MLKVREQRMHNAWSKKHGHDTYGDDEDSDTTELKPKEKAKRDKKWLKDNINVDLQHTDLP